MTVLFFVTVLFDEVRPKVLCIHMKLIIVCHRLRVVKKERLLVLIAGAPFPFRLFRAFSLFAPATQPSFIRSCDFRWHLNLRSGIPSSLFLLEAEAKGCLILYMLSLHSPESGLLSDW